MPSLISPNGDVVDVGDDKVAGALAQGYKIAGDQQVFSNLDERAKSDRANERGTLGTINAGLTGTLSGATLGLSDVALKGVLSPNEMDRLSAERDAHPYASGIGQLVGAVAPAILTGGASLEAEGADAAAGGAGFLSKTPAGYLSKLTGAAAESAKAEGGLSGLLGVAAATGAEGAVQSAGMYVSDVALGDRDLTAEGMAGALGSGFAFGALAGGATFGIERGSMSARRLFSRTLDGSEGAVKDAANAFDRTSDAIVRAHDEAAEVAAKQLEDIAAEKSALNETKMRADAEIAQTKVDALTERGSADEATTAAEPAATEPASAVVPAAEPPAPVAASGPAADDMNAKLEAALEDYKVKRAALEKWGASERAPVPPDRAAQLAEMQQDAIDQAALAEDDHGFAAAMHEAHGTDALAGGNPEDAASRLERQLAETSARLGKGEKLGALNAEGASRKAVTNPEALGDRTVADWLDKQTPGPGSTSLIDDVHESARVIGDFEKSSAALADALGDAAPAPAKQAAAAYHAAEDAADEAHLTRTARAVDDHAAAQAEGPIKRTPAERANDARAAKLRANADLAKLKITETDARAAHTAAVTARDEAKAAMTPAKAPKGKAAPKQVGIAHRIEQVATAAEAASALGVPGIPSPSDIPVIGPLLKVYLRAKALAAVAGKFAGKIPATGDARAAALAARTKERAAQAVDRMLGLTAKAARRATIPAAATAATVAHVLSKRVFDDGLPAPDEGASTQELAAARIREVTAAAANPDAVAAEVRKQMRDVTDPALIASAEKVRQAQFAYLAANAPKEPPPSPFSQRQWKPSAADAQTFARRMEVAFNPVAALEQVEQRIVSPEAAQTLRTVYPTLFAQVQQRLLQRATDMQRAVPYQQQVRMSMLFGVPLDRSLNPATIASLQTAHAANSTAAPTTQTSAPTPSVASTPDLTSLFQTPADRRAARR